MTVVGPAFFFRYLYVLTFSVPTSRYVPISASAALFFDQDLCWIRIHGTLRWAELCRYGDWLSMAAVVGIFVIIFSCFDVFGL